MAGRRTGQPSRAEHAGTREAGGAWWRRALADLPPLPARDLEELGGDAAGVELVTAVEGFRQAGAGLLEPAPAHDPEPLHGLLPDDARAAARAGPGSRCPADGRPTSPDATSTMPAHITAAARQRFSEDSSSGSAQKNWGARRDRETSASRRRSRRVRRQPMSSGLGRSPTRSAVEARPKCCPSSNLKWASRRRRRSARRRPSAGHSRRPMDCSGCPGADSRGLRAPDNRGASR